MEDVPTKILGQATFKIIHVVFLPHIEVVFFPVYGYMPSFNKEKAPVE